LACLEIEAESISEAWKEDPVSYLRNGILSYKICYKRSKTW
jgi:hypothetical protein